MLLYFFTITTLRAQHSGVVDIFPQQAENIIYKYVERNDTIFVLNVYSSTNNLDSIVVFVACDTKISKRVWMSKKNAEGSYRIMRFKKILPDKWFKQYNRISFHASHECKPTGKAIIFNANGEIIMKQWYFGNAVKIRTVKR